MSCLSFITEIPLSLLCSDLRNICIHLLPSLPTFIVTRLFSPLNGSPSSSPRASHTPSSEVFPTIPSRKGTLSSDAIIPLNVSIKKSRPSLHLEKGQIADMAFERPYYGLIVDGIHCHPNSVRVRILLRIYCESELLTILNSWHIPHTRRMYSCHGWYFAHRFLH